MKIADFSAPAEDLKLVLEAHRIRQAHIFDRHLAVHTSLVDPLPHQISAVYRELLPRHPIRYLLADDPGAGKTIMTGLLIKELITRGTLRRCLIVAPGNLVEQWQNELASKFQLDFKMFSPELLEPQNAPIFCIARLDKLVREVSTHAVVGVGQAPLLQNFSWDLVVFDEAHKLSARSYGDQTQRTQRYKLGELLAERCTHLLLLTATPHNGKDDDFRLFMRLLDKDRFSDINQPLAPKKSDADSPVGAGQDRLLPQSVAEYPAQYTADLMRRMVKEKLLTFDGERLFPERQVDTLPYNLSEAEQELYESVTEYVRNTYDKALKERYRNNIKGNQFNAVGFAMTILQRRLSSSPEAIYQSLRRRREKLQAKLHKAKYGEELAFSGEADEDFYERPEEEVEADEDKLEGLSLARDLKDLKREIEGLEGLELAAKHLRRSEHDSKWRALKEALAKDVHSEKLIIFTEHRDTLTYLADKLGDYLGNTDAVVIICGGMTMKARKAVEERFKTDPAVQVLVATDAAGEGINLQAAHLMINYDLPWNPNRIEQRFGRIHRIGQKHTCHLWNLVAMRTREGEVFNRLFEKLERERRALGGQVFDVLGKVAYGGETLRELLLRAVMEAAPESTVEQTLDAAFNRSTMQKLLQEYELDMRDFGARELCAIREEKERADASRLQPFYIKEFFEKAYKRINGRVREIGNKRFCIDEVERVLWKRHPKVAQRYAALTFDKNSVRIAGLEDAELVCPGHPLLEALVDFFLEKDYIKKGTVFVSEKNAEARLLFYIEDFIRDKRGEEIVHSLHFIECDIEGKRVLYAGTDAPHVDYRAQKPEEEEFVRKLREEMQMNLEEASAFVLDYVERELSKPRFAKLNDENEERLAKLRFELVKTIDGDINFYDKKAAEQWDKHGAGAPFAREKALEYTKRIDDLKERKRQRIAELEREGLVEPAPPVLLGLALVVPDYCLRENTAGPDTAARIRVERLAMQAVVKHEREIGNLPRDVSRECCGYDIESTLPGGVLRFIEVKGVSKGLETLTLTSNEINTAQNSRENFILAIVEVEGNSVLSLRYQCNLPLEKLGIAEVARTYKIAGLCAESEVVYDA